MQIFLALLFLLIGILSSTFSYFILFLLVPIYLYLFLYKKKDAKVLLYLLFTIIGIISFLLFPKGKNEVNEIIGICVYKKDTYYLLYSFKGKYIIFDNSNDVCLFSILRISGRSKELAFSHYESGFDFTKYLSSHGVYKEFVTSKIKLLFNSHYNLKPLKSYIFKYLSDDSIDLISSILFGQSLSKADNFSSLNELSLTSIFSLSGIHLSSLFALLNKYAYKRFKHGIIINNIISFLFLFLSGFKFALRRIFLSQILLLISNYSKRKIDGVSQTSVVAMIMLVIEPYSIISPSFYYSFPFIFFLKLFNNSFSNRKSKMKFYLLLLSFFFPFRLYERYSFSLLSPILQLIFLPLTHLLFHLSILLLLVPHVGYLINYISAAIIYLTKVSNNFNLVLISGKPLLVFTIVYYLLILFFLVLRTYNYKRLSKKIAIITFLVASCNFIPDYTYHNEITFIDVDQGDSTLIRYKNKNLLIDTGGKINIDLAKECLIPYFHKRKIRKLDAVIITHLDYDHYGALNSLNKYFDVSSIYYAEDFLNKENNMMNICGLNIRNLNHYHISNNTNDTSGVYRFDIKDKKILIMGDAPKEVEYKLIEEKADIDVDILKVGHHGSKTSTSIEFLKKTSPKYTIISCGLNNRYKFPNTQVLDNISKIETTLLRTDLCGSISLRL